MNINVITGILFLLLVSAVLMAVIKTLEWFERFCGATIKHLNDGTETKYGFRLYSTKTSFLVIGLYGVSFMYPILSAKDGEIKPRVKSLAQWIASQNMIRKTFLHTNSSASDSSLNLGQAAQPALIASVGVFTILVIVFFLYIWLRTSFLQAVLFFPTWHMLAILQFLGGILPFLRGFFAGAAANLPDNPKCRFCGERRVHCRC